MPGPTTTFDPAKHFLNFLNNRITGFFDGTWLSIERDEDSFMLKVGADGEKARAKNNNTAGKLNFTLMQSAPSNTVLAGIVKSDELFATGIGPCTLKDSLGFLAASCPDAYLLRPAKAERGKEILGVEWTIVMPSLELFTGGAIIATP